LIISTLEDAVEFDNESGTKIPFEYRLA